MRKRGSEQECDPYDEDGEESSDMYTVGGFGVLVEANRVIPNEEAKDGHDLISLLVQPIPKLNGPLSSY